MIPCSLYIHIPWCEKKCPYCDFNSHEPRGDFSEKAYLQALQRDLEEEASRHSHKTISSIFIGGGTPSLLSAEIIFKLLESIQKLFILPKDCEITLEANPNSSDYLKFLSFFDAGINRLSIGIQSTQDHLLKKIGRLHSSQAALTALETALSIPFNSINVDLMYGLPQQSPKEALKDLQTIIQMKPPHLSWYQLTLEPNTYFYKYPPKLPKDIQIEQMDSKGQKLLQEAGYQRYEISAYTQKAQDQSKHNLNYWLYGDYIGVGAGACGKETTENPFIIRRYKKRSLPKDYNNNVSRTQIEDINKSTQLMEFMMNVLRLNKQPIPFQLLKQRTSHQPSDILQQCMQLQKKGFLNPDYVVTEKGLTFLEDMLLSF